MKSWSTFIKFKGTDKLSLKLKRRERIYKLIKLEIKSHNNKQLRDPESGKDILKNLYSKNVKI